MRWTIQESIWLYLIKSLNLNDSGQEWASAAESSFNKPIAPYIAHHMQYWWMPKQKKCTQRISKTEMNSFCCFTFAPRTVYARYISLRGSHFAWTSHSGISLFAQHVCFLHHVLLVNISYRRHDNCTRLVWSKLMYWNPAGLETKSAQTSAATDQQVKL